VERQDTSKEKQIKTVAGKMLTLECPLPDNHPLIDELTVSPDPDTEGVLILDPHNGPKWRLVATRAPTIVHMPQNVEKVTVLNKKDEVLGCHLMQIKFKDGDSPIAGGTKHECCFPTDELLQGLVRVHHGSDRLKASPRGGRGRGRGRGSGGRGRGRR
jgi:DNA topoisomerase III